MLCFRILREKKIDIWKHFIITIHESKKSAVCRYCEKKYSNANITRLGNHIAKQCKKFSAVVNQVDVEEEDENNVQEVQATAGSSSSNNVLAIVSTSSSTNALQLSAELPQSASPSVQRTKVVKITQFLDTITSGKCK